MSITIPSALQAEHHELHAELAAATQTGGRTGEAAKAVARLMHPHFVAEEEFALPPLGLLGSLTSGEIGDERAGVLAMTERLRAELPRMLAEHRAIVGALDALAIAASDEGKPEIATFARKLIQHAMMEEQVMYPAALVVGDLIRTSRPIKPRETPPVDRFDLVAELAALRAITPTAVPHHVAKTLSRTSSLRLVLIAMDAGAKLAEHVAEGMIAIHVIEGRVRLQVPGSDVDLPAGALATVERDVKHGVEAIEKSGLLLSIAWTGHA